jgi:hypothetical protein
MRGTIGSRRLTHLPHPGAGSKGAQHKWQLYPRQRIALRGRSTGLLSVSLLRPVLGREITQTPMATGSHCQKPQGGSRSLRSLTGLHWTPFRVRPMAFPIMGASGRVIPCS